MSVLGVRSLMLGFGDNSESFIVGSHGKYSWGEGTQEFILKMWMNRYRCGIIITIIEKGNGSSRAGRVM